MLSTGTPIADIRELMQAKGTSQAIEIAIACGFADVITPLENAC
jgi:hypothetical protein